MDFIINNCQSISEKNLKKIIEMIVLPSDYLSFLACSKIRKLAKTCSQDFKKYVAEFLMKRFLNLYLQTDKAN